LLCPRIFCFGFKLRSPPRIFSSRSQQSLAVDPTHRAFYGLDN
jgi:hypothetical protein